MNEVWKTISGYEGLYEISNYGNVRKKNGALLKGQANGKYREILLTKDKVRKKYKIHRLVAQAFIPNPHGFPLINHIDECPSNNNANNLEWCSNKYNINYGTCILRRSANHHKPINQFSGTTFVKRWNSIKEAGDRLGIDHSSITKAARGKRKSAGGFYWKYECG